MTQHPTDSSVGGSNSNATICLCPCVCVRVCVCVWAGSYLWRSTLCSEQTAPPPRSSPSSSPPLCCCSGSTQTGRSQTTGLNPTAPTGLAVSPSSTLLQVSKHCALLRHRPFKPNSNPSRDRLLCACALRSFRLVASREL